MNSLTRRIERSLERAPQTVRYDLSRNVADIFEGQVVLETEDRSFDVTAYAKAGECSLMLTEDATPLIDTDWDDENQCAKPDPLIATFEVAWKGQPLKLVSVDIGWGCRRLFLVAERRDVAHQFFEAVCRFSRSDRGEAMIFQNGLWQRSSAVTRSVGATSWDDLLLPPGMADEIIQEAQGFFESEQTFRRHEVPWRRGLLFTGPSGNGKTMAVKALARKLGKPMLFVRSLVCEELTEDRLVDRVFAKARRMAPCLLVIEDFDRIADGHTGAALLGELDGVASNRGILLIATARSLTNVDAAAVERPGRLDRRFAFDNPEPRLRWEYLRRWTHHKESPLRLTEADLRRLARATEGYSFAALRELCLATALALSHSGEKSVPVGKLMDKIQLRVRGEMLRAATGSAATLTETYSLVERMGS